MSIKIFDLHFDVDFYYLKRDSIVDKIVIDNRTFYSKYEKINQAPSELLIHQHLKEELTVALPCISKKNIVNYVIIEYEKESTNRFYYLLKQILKSLYIEDFYTYESAQKNHIQIFIPFEKLRLEEAYQIVEKIEFTIESKSDKRCSILPAKHFPKIYNKITLPLKKM